MYAREFLASSGTSFNGTFPSEPCARHLPKSIGLGGLVVPPIKIDLIVSLTTGSSYTAYLSNRAWL
jgi:hypothetical protein